MKKLIFKVLPWCVTAAVLLTALFLMLPYIIDSFILPRLLQGQSDAEQELSVSKISPFNLRAQYYLRENAQSVISIPTADLHYTPSSLLHGKASSLVLANCSMHLFFDGTSVRFGSSNRTRKEKSAEINQAFSLPHLPAAVSAVHLSDMRIIVHDTRDNEEFSFRINGKAELNYVETGRFSKQLTGGRIHFSGSDALSFAGVFAFEQHEKNLELVLDNFSLHKLEQLQQLTHKNVSGLYGQIQGSAKARFAVKNNTLLLHSFSSQLGSDTLRFMHDNITITTSKEAPLQISAKGTSEKVQYSINNISVATPAAATVEIDGSWAKQGSQSIVSGDVSLSSPQTADSPVTFSYSLTQQKNATPSIFTVNSNWEKALSFSDQQTRYTIGPGNLAVNGTWQGQNLTADIQGTLQSMSTIRDKQQYTLQGLRLNIPLTADKDQLTLDMRLQAEQAQAPQLEIDAANMLLHLPLNRSATGKVQANRGNFSIARINHRNQKIAGLKGDITFLDSVFQSKGSASILAGKDIRLTYDARAETGGDFTVHVKSNNFTLTEKDIAPFYTLPSGFTFDGSTQLTAFFSITDKLPASGMVLTLAHYNLHNKESKIDLEDINLTLELDSLTPLTSAPSQLVTIARLSAGTFSMSDARIFFRLEKNGNIFIEKSRFDWCDGKVETGSLRITPERKEVQTTLYCDRLNLAKLLDQFGIEDTEGDGSLNGNLLVKITEKGVYFDDGFLFSTPGTNGILHLSKSAMLTDSMAGIEQTGTLSYSMEALKNFAYTWSQITFTSREDTLTMGMKLNGRPDKPLPYGYKNGQIVSDPEGAGLQHPLQLDLNFNLPQEDIFQFGKNLQSLKENL